MWVGAQDAELGEGVSVDGQPSGAGAFEPGVEPMLVAAFDEPAADGQFAGDGPGVVSVQRRAAQAAHFLDQQRFDLGGRAQRAAFDLRQRAHGLETPPQIRAASPPLGHLCFKFGSRGISMFWVHGLGYLTRCPKKYA